LVQLKNGNDANVDADKNSIIRVVIDRFINTSLYLCCLDFPDEKRKDLSRRSSRYKFNSFSAGDVNKELKKAFAPIINTKRYMFPVAVQICAQKIHPYLFFAIICAYGNVLAPIVFKWQQAMLISG